MAVRAETRAQSTRRPLPGEAKRTAARKGNGGAGKHTRGEGREWGCSPVRPGTAREVLKSWGWFAAADGFRTCGGGEAGWKATARKTPGLARAWRQRGPSEDGRNSAGFYQQERICPEIERSWAGQMKKGQTNKGRELGSLLLPASTAAGRRAARLMDGGSRTQRAQTGSRRKILPRPNTERTGANRRGKKKKKEQKRDLAPAQMSSN